MELVENDRVGRKKETNLHHLENESISTDGMLPPVRVAGRLAKDSSVNGGSGVHDANARIQFVADEEERALT
jgi:hypothetical protein